MGERLIRKLRQRLTAAELEALKILHEAGASNGQWNEVRVRQRAAELEERVDHIRRRIEAKAESLVDAPRGRQVTVLRNGSPALLVAYTYQLMRESYENRFDRPKRSLDLAELALEAAELVSRQDLLGPESCHDLLAEAWSMLGNARRLVGAPQAAEKAFSRASHHLRSGSGDRLIRADYLSLLASLRFSQGEPERAIELQDREIRLRRLLGDAPGLGNALLDRGIASAWCEPLHRASRFMAEGLRLIHDRRRILMAAYALAEQQARAGSGLEALKSLHVAESASLLAGDRSFDRAHRWISGVTHRALGHLEIAEVQLKAVRAEFVEEGNAFRAAMVSLDLTAVYAAQGRHREIRELIGEAFANFVAERLERPALAAFQLLRRAAETEQLSESLAVEVVNFLVRFQHNRRLEFKLRADG